MLMSLVYSYIKELVIGNVSIQTGQVFVWTVTEMIQESKWAWRGLS